MIEEIEQGMILYTQGNKIKHDVAHFLKVHQYARLIGKLDRKSTRLNSSHIEESRMPSSA